MPENLAECGAKRHHHPVTTIEIIIGASTQDVAKKTDIPVSDILIGRHGQGKMVPVNRIQNIVSDIQVGGERQVDQLVGIVLIVAVLLDPGQWKPSPPPVLKVFVNC